MRSEGWIPRDVREPVQFPGRVVLPDGRAVEVVVTDVSEQGCRIRTSATLPIAASVRLELAGKSFDASVRWTLAGEAGLKLVAQAADNFEEAES